jgi:hypothetical protein
MPVHTEVLYELITIDRKSLIKAMVPKCGYVAELLGKQLF